ncbi:MAG: hypothetical protein DHS20C15_34940 [Planctomycetota bacterium]|nr:MAG: hypothetical protein DHS20C15_34940 [Planctomycetota bacterium]
MFGWCVLLIFPLPLWAIFHIYTLQHDYSFVCTHYTHTDFKKIQRLWNTWYVHESILAVEQYTNKGM